MGAKRQAKKEFEKQQELDRLREKAAQKEALTRQTKERQRAALAARHQKLQARLSGMSPEQRARYDRNQRWVARGVLAVLVLGVGGCIAWSVTDDDPADERTSQPTAGDSGDEIRTDELRRYLDENFATTSWYGGIASARVEDAIAIVEVNVPAGEMASRICSGVSGWVFRNGSDVSGLRIVGSSGDMLISRASVSDRC